MTYILDKQTQGPATHALVIGVGEYNHLVGGSGDLSQDYNGLSQLSSPPISAFEFAKWLTTEYNNPSKPLSSLSLFISAENVSTFNLLQKDHNIDKASMENVKPAIRQWMELGHKNKNNLTIFYFCGHGIASGYQLSLLLDDFGNDIYSPLQNAIDFQSFHQGMSKCMAQEQLYFIDACRIASPTLIQSHNYSGDPIIEPSVYVSPERKCPVYYSTVAGDGAYGRINSSSYFTEALLNALKGAGSDDVDGNWRIYTDRLDTGISHYIKRTAGDNVHQASTTSHVEEFAFHYLDGEPIVPVSVDCDPIIANEHAKLSADNGIQKYERRQNNASTWKIDLKTGKYDFSAEFRNQLYRNKSITKYVRPPYRKIPIEVL